MDTMMSQPPVVSYRSAEGPGEDGVGAIADHPAEKILTVLTWAMLFVVLAVWTVAGAIFWIPLMFRAMIVFCISLIETAFEDKKPASAAKALRNAVGFYRRGFVVAIEVVMRTEVRGDQIEATAENRLLIEVLWAILVWYFIFLLFGWIQASPLDLVDWFISIPWAEHFGDLIQRFRV
jgi:hypothetical protein